MGLFVPDLDKWFISSSAHGFKLGDQVVLIDYPSDSTILKPGTKGIVKYIYDDPQYLDVGVEFEGYTKGHELHGSCPGSKAGWFVGWDKLQKVLEGG